MMTCRFVIAVILFGIFVQPQTIGGSSVPACLHQVTPGYYSTERCFYYYITERVTWANANQSCHNNGMELAAITDAVIERHVLELVRNSNTASHSTFVSTVHPPPWLGGHRSGCQVARFRGGHDSSHSEDDDAVLHGSGERVVIETVSCDSLFQLVCIHPHYNRYRFTPDLMKWRDTAGVCRRGYRPANISELHLIMRSTGNRDIRFWVDNMAWLWSTGDEMEYTNWYGNASIVHTYEKMCMSIIVPSHYPSRRGTWLSGLCDVEQRPYVCQIDRPVDSFRPSGPMVSPSAPIRDSTVIHVAEARPSGPMVSPSAPTRDSTVIHEAEAMLTTDTTDINNTLLHQATSPRNISTGAIVAITLTLFALLVIVGIIGTLCFFNKRKKLPEEVNAFDNVTYSPDENGVKIPRKAVEPPAHNDGTSHKNHTYAVIDEPESTPDASSPQGGDGNVYYEPLEHDDVHSPHIYDNNLSSDRTEEQGNHKTDSREFDEDIQMHKKSVYHNNP